MIPPSGAAPSRKAGRRAVRARTAGTGPQKGRSHPLPPPLIETNARPFLLHPRHPSRPLRSRILAAGVSPALTRASGLSNATWWQAEQSTFTKSPRPRSSIRAGYRGNIPSSTFPQCSLLEKRATRLSAADKCNPARTPISVAGPLRVLWRIVLRRGSSKTEGKAPLCGVAAVRGGHKATVFAAGSFTTPARQSPEIG